MSNLIQQYGMSFFNNKFRGSFFYDDVGKPSYVNRADDSGVNYFRVGGTAEKPIKTIRKLDHDFFKGFDTFSVPSLGWRFSHEGRFLAFFSRNNRSYVRGLGPTNLVVQHSSLTRWLAQSRNFSITLEDKHLCLLSLTPSFLPFNEGVELMRKGDIISFAMSDCVAVLPAEDDKFDIYFRQTKAGQVMPDNSIEVTIPLLKHYIGE